MQETQNEITIEETATAEETKETTEQPKKPISLRLPTEDIALAKDLAEQMGVGYQTLLCQLIHAGLEHEVEKMQVRKLIDAIKASLPEMKAAQELAESPAVKAAQDLLSSPTVKTAQDLLASPAIKAAHELAESPALRKVREMGSSSALKAAEELAASPFGKMIQEFTESPTFKAAQDLANTTSNKLAREWANSAGGRLVRDFASSIEAPKSAKAESADDMQTLMQSVNEMREALLKAGLMK